MTQKSTAIHAALGVEAGQRRRVLCRWCTSAPRAPPARSSIGFWDHWVPGGNDVMQKQVDAWAEKNKVEVTADFITGNGNKLLMTGVAEVAGEDRARHLYILQLGRVQHPRFAGAGG